MNFLRKITRGQKNIDTEFSDLNHSSEIAIELQTEHIKRLLETLQAAVEQAMATNREYRESKHAEINNKIRQYAENAFKAIKSGEEKKYEFNKEELVKILAQVKYYIQD